MITTIIFTLALLFSYNIIKIRVYEFRYNVQNGRIYFMPTLAEMITCILWGILYYISH